MRVISEKYTDTLEAYNEVHAFLRKMVLLTGKLQTWEFIRLEFWKRHEAVKSTDPYFMENQARLWKHVSGELAGLFISENGGEFFSLIVHPDYPYIAKEMVSWVKNVWGKENKKLNTDCYEHSLEVQALLNAGFIRNSHIGNTRRYDLLNTEYTIALEEGFSIKSMKEAADYEGKSELIQRIFDPGVSNPVKEAYWRKDLPSYRKELDFSVVDHEERHIAFCFGFVDQDQEIAIIETIGTHPAYRKRGFGKAVITACFKQLKQQGIKTAYITGFSAEANALYQSLKPVEIFPINSYLFER